MLGSKILNTIPDAALNMIRPISFFGLMDIAFTCNHSQDGGAYLSDIHFHDPRALKLLY